MKIQLGNYIFAGFKHVTQTKDYKTQADLPVAKKSTAISLLELDMEWREIKGQMKWDDEKKAWVSGDAIKIFRIMDVHVEGLDKFTVGDRVQCTFAKENGKPKLLSVDKALVKSSWFEVAK